MAVHSNQDNAHSYAKLGIIGEKECKCWDENQAEDILDRLKDEAQDWTIPYIFHSRKEPLDHSEQPI